jgi:hypothetical protein
MKKKSRAETLIDTFYQASFLDDPGSGWINPKLMRNKLREARRYVLDEGMSRFLADLATASFTNKANAAVCASLCDQMRISARLPHRLMWVEYNLKEQIKRLNEIRAMQVERAVPLVFDKNTWNQPFIDPEQVPQTEGWLLEQHPGIETAFRLHLFNGADKEQLDGYTYYTFPLCYAWTVDDNPLPWRTVIDPQPREIGALMRAASETYTGVLGYLTDKVGIVKTELLKPADKYPEDALQLLIQDWTGIMRRVWAFLATMTDIPTLRREVKASKGFMGKREYHKFLDHNVLTLHVPSKLTTIKLARNLVAKARRKAHNVSGHWRLDWHHPGSPNCHHEWGEDKICKLCGAHRMWIHEHVRGDATLGFVSHDYNVTHD